ncbi:MAG: ABC transporter ATP-binding protein [Actinomycetota bacterium]|nr:ABC transporter ATP-binding protein [Actinomycetota bacterium]
MPASAVELHHVSKRYLLGEDHAPGATLRDAITGVFRHRGWRHRGERAEIWSLRDVDLTVAAGESLGIIGRNGAGKSTLLKVLTRITEPTSGVSRTRGRVGALLEVGTGFHPELTGRENVFLNGAILGMSRQQIKREYDAIVDFSGIERFLDTPVKRYSSGMYLRLAFAVAAHLQADIMVVDEILAVGDADFQRKCLGKMAEVERSGRTVLFASHNLEAIVRLCPESIWLDRGRLLARGPSEQIVDAYLASGVSRTPTSRYDDPAEPVALRSVSVLDASGRSSAVLRRAEPFTIEVCFEVARPVPGLDLSVVLSTLRDVRVLDEAWSDSTATGRGGPGRYRARLLVPPALAVGEYTVGVWLGTAFEAVLWQEGALQFRLEGDTHGRAERLVQLSLGWEVQRVPTTDSVGQRGCDWTPPDQVGA